MDRRRDEAVVERRESSKTLLHMWLLRRLKRGLMAGSTATREELIARVKANMNAPRT
jgi:hypothetical protein